MNLILQEVSAEPEIEIPDRLRDAYNLSRPTLLYRAPDAAHAIRAAIDGAVADAGGGPVAVRPRQVVVLSATLFGLSGHANFEMSAYEAYLGGRLQDRSSPSRTSSARSRDCRTRRR